ncbi:serine/threonine-protein kinase MPS1-like [Silene latifolia]|uniref:serine/threonine-protein kinase MPS1-like n=1 Tax=Silene latifolia TaxID=37657 RepID=UPI003D7808C1
MHDARITHCDLKPANIMLAKNDNPIIEDNVRIIDFGASCSFGEDVTIATDAYCNEGEQEQGEKTKASPQRDIYAFGSILIHLLCRNSEVRNDVNAEQ